MSDFFKDLVRGKQGEVLVANAFRDMGYEVTDVTGDSDYWKKDIDLLIDDNGIERSMEVKADWNMGTTGNVVLEAYKENNPETEGWYRYTESSHLAFVDMRNKIAYICRTNELRERVGSLMVSGTEGNDISAYIKIKSLNGYRCYLLNVENNEDLFQKVAV